MLLLSQTAVNFPTCEMKQMKPIGNARYHGYRTNLHGIGLVSTGFCKVYYLHVSEGTNLNSALCVHFKNQP